MLNRLFMQDSMPYIEFRLGDIRCQAPGISDLSVRYRHAWRDDLSATLIATNYILIVQLNSTLSRTYQIISNFLQ
jgi:hypothetical protein